jgi:hypothetical protein
MNLQSFAIPNQDDKSNLIGQIRKETITDVSTEKSLREPP